MPKRCLRQPYIPPSLSGTLLVNEDQQPRFWATVWRDVLLADVKDSTHARHLDGVQKLYQTASDQFGTDHLDSIITALDIDGLEFALGSLLAKLRNQSSVYAVDQDAIWTSALAAELPRGFKFADGTMLAVELLKWCALNARAGTRSVFMLLFMELTGLASCELLNSLHVVG